MWGDSRLYLAREVLRQITQDHSLVAEMVRLGELSPEEARNHPDKNIITRAVGTAEDVKIDFFDIKAGTRRPAADVFRLVSAIWFRTEISWRYSARVQGRTRPRELVDQANANGGKDNIAVIVIEPFTNEVKGMLKRGELF